jgi:6-phospho-beta-glucosidase
MGQFPKKFLWGASTSAYQVEGAANTHGKKYSQQDILNRKAGFTDASVTSDHYHRYKEDVSLMKELGLKSYRFSIAWTRIFPDGVGEVNSEGVEFYHNLLDELIENNIEPIVTLYHYDFPLTLVEKYGGWVNRQSVRDYEYYSEFVVKEYSSKVKYWTTINEQSIIVQYIDKKNLIPEKYKGNDQIRYQINHHMNLAHALSCQHVHKYVEGGQVGSAIGYAPVYAISSKPEDQLAALNANSLRNYFFLDIYFKGEYNSAALSYLKINGLAPVIEDGDMDIIKAGYSDFLALNYYYSDAAKAPDKDAVRKYSGVNLTGKKGDISGHEIQPDFYEIVNNPELATTDWDWAIDPLGLQYILRDIYERYGKPLMITENGIGAFDELQNGMVHDNYRIEYIKEHLKAIKNAIDFGVEVISYNPWSFIDVLSTSNGYKKRYGFIYIDRTDKDLKKLSRIKKDSFYWYQNVISSNGVDI